jgi:AraC-like DNA-binding protein
MTELAIARASYLHVYIDVLREIGVPVERELAHSPLPTWIEDAPDAYVSIPAAIDWVARCGRDLELMEIGLLAARRTTLAAMELSFQQALLDAPTGFARMDTFLRAVAGEDSSLTIGTRREGEHIRIVCDTLRFDDNPAVCLAEWLNVQATVAVMRSIVGPRWCPTEITFVASSPPTKAVREVYGNTRILTGRPHTSILVEAAGLARPCHECIRTPISPTAANSAWSFARALRAVVRPYLSDGYPTLEHTAEAIGMSRRTLQRRLQDCGRTYSEVVAEARVELAFELLTDTNLRIIDVALAVGYENPQHFSRLFRRMTGMTPRSYRQSVLIAG